MEKNQIYRQGEWDLVNVILDKGFQYFTDFMDYVLKHYSMDDVHFHIAVDEANLFHMLVSDYWRNLQDCEDVEDLLITPEQEEARWEAWEEAEHEWHKKHDGVRNEEVK